MHTWFFILSAISMFASFQSPAATPESHDSFFICERDAIKIKEEDFPSLIDILSSFLPVVSDDTKSAEKRRISEQSLNTWWYAQDMSLSQSDLEEIAFRVAVKLYADVNNNNCDHISQAYKKFALSTIRGEVYQKLKENHFELNQVNDGKIQVLSQKLSLLGLEFMQILEKKEKVRN